MLRKHLYKMNRANELNFCIIYISIAFILFSSLSRADDCINNKSSNPKCTFGTKTAYRYVANYNDSQLKYKDCTEQKIWMIIRHGTRYPKENHIQSLSTRLPVLKENILYNYSINNSKISKHLSQRLHDWEIKMSRSSGVKLGIEGQQEMVDLAKRTKSRFPKLFLQDYKASIYDIHHTPTHRTQQSAKYFSIGLFGKRKNEIQYPVSEERSFIMRFYKYCKRWQETVHHNPETFKEKRTFLNSNLVHDMLRNISKDLGFVVGNDDVRLMRMICVFETALDKTKNSPWCDIFSFDQLKILEYVEDLSYYWKDGYGYRLTYEQACPALKDVFNFFQMDTNRSATVYFTHSGTILKLLALMNIAKDERPLTHDTFLLHRDNRNWRVSQIDAFASNIAFVLYECEDGPGILTMHQERVVNLPGCPQDRPCPLSIMKKLYVDNDEECHFDSMCSLREKSEL